MAMQSYSIVEYYAGQEGYKCGYCKSPDTYHSHGMWAHSLTVQDYQGLIDRGWRRCGCYCYKPTLDRTCCPMYTIKCEALHFKISKSQKKVLKKMVKFLRNELKKDEAKDINEDGQRDNIDISIGDTTNYNKHLLRAQQNSSKINVSSIDSELNGRLKSNKSDKDAKSCDSSNEQKSLESISSVSKHDDNPQVSLQNSQVVHSSSVPTPCKKAKLLRIERKQNKLLAQGKTQKEVEAILKESKPQNHIKSLEELFNEVHSGSKKLELRLVRTSPMSSEYQKTARQSYEVYRKYETTIHGVPEEKVTEAQYTRFLVNSPLQIKLVRVMSDEFRSTFDVSADLYRKYQMAIHGDPPHECDKQSFFKFLVKSSLQQWIPEDGPPEGYGSFHNQYWLNNELIAVGVIDILPFCISSVYFFYDPAYSHLSLGTFSSLREVYLTRQLNRVAGNLKYYYMGFYIHTCPKMRYKARIQPSKLLCPETYKWFDIEPCLTKLDKEKYSRLNDDIDAIDEDGVVDVHKVLVLYRGIAMPYKLYKIRSAKRINREDEEEVKQYARLVGMTCAQSLLLYRD